LLKEEGNKLGETMNIGWTIGEEILFEKGNILRKEKCCALEDSCLIGVERKRLGLCKKTLIE
jgi:hypothetical protein